MKAASTSLRTQIIEEALRREFLRRFDAISTARAKAGSASVLDDNAKFIEATGAMLQELDRLHEIHGMLREKL